MLVVKARGEHASSAGEATRYATDRRAHDLDLPGAPAAVYVLLARAIHVGMVHPGLDLPAAERPQLLRDALGFLRVLRFTSAARNEWSLTFLVMQ